MVNRKGVILTLALVFIIILGIVTGITLVIMINQARVTEYQIKRYKAIYTAESALVKGADDLRRNGGNFSSWDFTFSLNCITITTTTSTVIRCFTATAAALGSGPYSTRKITAAVVY